ncbi:MAG: histidine--tRNA ligase [Alphaproteobacteria bacterium]|nr:MAG: histidine--tRNA ligase [Alphaproteobacteria bacterium]
MDQNPTLQRVTPRLPSGTLELLPRQQIAFQHLMDTIRCGYERFGFLPIETPVFELTDVLLTKSGGETEKQVYFVQSTGSLKQGDTPDMALRFDLTVPLARYVAQHERELNFPFRRYQMQRVYRGERAQKGREREFYQCDIDIIGKDHLDIGFDSEPPAIINHIFGELGVGDFVISYNNRKLLKGLLSSLDVPEGEAQTLALREVDKLDKLSPDVVSENLAKLGMAEAARSRLLELMSIRSGTSDALAALRAWKSDHPLFVTGVQEVERVAADLKAMGVSEDRARLNLSIVRGLDYYTGTVYETHIKGHENFGSVCSGGRYDDLASHYTKSTLPGVGISIGATRLFEQMMEAGLVGAADSTVQVLVARLDEGLASDYLSIATALRKQGVNTEAWLQPGAKMDKQMRYADKAGIRFVVMMGANEKASGQATFKDMRSGVQQTVSAGDLAAHIAGALRS